MKDIEYFINAEKAYREKHKDNDESYYDPSLDEYVFAEYSDNFLAKGSFTEIANHIENCNIDKKFDLSPVEILMLYAFMGDMSRYFKPDYYSQYNEIPKEAKEMQIILDSLIRKAPKHNGDILYRFLTPDDNDQLSVGDIFEPNHSLTTTIDNWKQDTSVYYITPLHKDKTSAYDLYYISNHGGEMQVNFLVGAKFRVVKVDIINSNIKHIYINEIE